MKLDFKSSLAATQKIGPQTMKPEDKFLKLAMLADLSGGTSTPYFDQFLKVSSDKDAKMMAALEVVRRSSNPMKKSMRRKNILKGRMKFLLLKNLNTFGKLRTLKQ